MSTIKHVVFDMDDVLCNTSAYILERLKSIYKIKGELEKLACVISHEQASLSTFYFDKDIRDDIWNYVVADGRFALSAFPTPMVNRSFIDMLELAERKGIGRHICTHRGYMKDNKGLTYTEFWLNYYGVREYFDNIFVIRSAEHPDKLAFLDEALDTEDYRLVDDNPLHDIDKDHPQNDKLIIYDEINLLNGYRLNLHTNDPVSEIIKLIK